MTDNKAVDINFNPKQAEAYLKLLDKETNEILFGGSSGCGKSTLGVLWIILQSQQYPGTRWLIGRSKLVDLRKTTLNTFFEQLSKLGYKEGEYQYNQQDNIIRFRNGSEVVLKDLAEQPSDPNYDSLGSLELTGAFIDEASMISSQCKNIVNSRIRFKLDEFGLIPKLLMSCNPSTGFLKDEYYTPWANGVLPTYKAFIPALVDDNKENVSVHYKANLERLDPVNRERLLYGNWDYQSDYSLINPNAILSLFKPVELQEESTGQTINKKYLTVDVARYGGDSSVVYVWDGYTIVEHQRLFNVGLDVLAEQVKLLINKYQIPLHQVVVDDDGVGGGLIDFALKGCISFVNNSRPLGNENYVNLKSQCFFKLAELINSGVIRITDPILLTNEVLRNRITKDLSVIIQDKIDKDSKLAIIPKDKMKRKLNGKSPDFADAMMLRCYFSAAELSPNQPTYEYLILVR